MLVLSRKASERIVIGNGIVVTVIKVQGNQVRIGIEAPAEVAIRRAELLPASEMDPVPTISLPKPTGDVPWAVCWELDPQAATRGL
ncbi:MAG: carbon storage regulator [Gemmataceae bacterium]|nr:carbon storage regulator [Gemmataceae bacterium]